MRRSVASYFSSTLTGEIAPEHFVKAILELVENRRYGKYLDIGCNDGRITWEISTRAEVSETWGIDIAEKALEIAKERGIKPVYFDLNEKKKLPFPENHFDIITCLETIEHVLFPDYLIKEIYRVLKPSGYVIISTPRLDSLYVISLLILGFQPGILSTSEEYAYGAFPKERKFRPSGHIHLFTKKAMEEMLKKNSLKIVCYRSVNLYIRGVPLRKDTQIWKASKCKTKCISQC